MKGTYFAENMFNEVSRPKFPSNEDGLFKNPICF